MQKIVIAFAVFAAVTLYAISRGGDVDISSEAKGISYSETAASAPSAAASTNTPPAASSEIGSTLAKH